MDVRGRIREELIENSEEKYRDFSRMLTPGQEAILGVRMPVLRAMSKALSEDDWRGYMEGEDGSFEETMIRGLTVCLVDVDAKERMRLVEDFVPMIDNWAVCDAFCSSMRFRRKDLPMLWESVLAHSDDGTEFGMRYAAVTMKCHFLDDEHIGPVLEMLSAMRHDGYYLKMGVAWALSECYITHPRLTDAVLRSGRLEDDVLRMAIGKIIDSRRVGPEAKDDLRRLRSGIRSP